VCESLDVWRGLEAKDTTFSNFNRQKLRGGGEKAENRIDNNKEINENYNIRESKNAEKREKKVEGRESAALKFSKYVILYWMGQLE
jgi:hypothetical protein